jgi:hypothetical protein
MKACQEEEANVDNMCKRIGHTITQTKEELRCQRHRLNFSEMALRALALNKDSTTQVLREIEENFRPIKQVPDEIWLEILHLAVGQANEALSVNADHITSSAALVFSHVCLTWRRVMLSCPTIWATLHCSALYGKSLEKRHKLMDLLLHRARRKPILIIDKRQYRSQTDFAPSWWPSNSTNNLFSRLSGYTYRAILSDQQSLLQPNYCVMPTPNAVILEAAVPGEPVPLSDAILNTIKDIRVIKARNIILRPRNPIVSQTLAHLAITFDSPFPRSSINTRTYCLLPLLSDSLKSLSLSHYDFDTVSWQNGRTIDLPDLHTLSITPHEHHIISALCLPKLRTLTISLPHGPVGVPTETWVTKLATLCTNISNLALDWVKPDLFALNKSAPIDMVSVFTLLHSNAPKLNALKFVAGVMDGHRLSIHLEKIAESTPKRLTSLTIDGCVGFSQADCERLRPIVGKLDVFRSEWFSYLKAFLTIIPTAYHRMPPT